MSKTNKIILSVAAVAAFVLLFIFIAAECDAYRAGLTAIILVVASVGALKIIWKNEDDEKQQ